MCNFNIKFTSVSCSVKYKRVCPVSQQIVRLQQIVCHCMILEVSTE